MAKSHKKYTILVSDERVIQKLDNLPQRSKGAYITQAIIDRMNRESDVVDNEKKIVELIRKELQKILNNQITYE